MLPDENLDASDIPDPTSEPFTRAIARRSLEPLPRKQKVTFRIDADVLFWFKVQGRGHQSRIIRLLREYIQAVGAAKK